MTNKQAKIYRTIHKRHNLNAVLRACGISDYLELQRIVDPQFLNFSDREMDENTSIFLTNACIEVLEQRRLAAFDRWITRAIAIAALIISFIALFH